MLFLISHDEDPTSDDCGVYEATTVAKALEQADSDGWGDYTPRDGSEPALYVFEVKKSSKRKFAKRTVWVNDKAKASAA